MDLNSIKTASKTNVPVRPQEVETFEKEFWLKFPDGYRNFITKFGEGLLAGFIRIYPPWRIRSELPEWRKRINKYWFWGDDKTRLPKARALECVIIGDTGNGDELVFHPHRPNQIFVLPAEEEEVFVAGSDLDGAFEWIATSGAITDALEEETFEPFDSRVQETEESEAGIEDPEGESLDELLNLGKEWAKRHQSRKLARKELKSHVLQGSKTEVLYEGLLWEGEKFSYDTGYTVAFRIVDKTSGQALGTYHFHQGQDSYGSSFVPEKDDKKK